jgi:hypothetical protein
MVERLLVQIPNGFPVGDLWVRQAKIKQLDGYDEQMLAETSNLPTFLRTNLLLERLVTFDELKGQLSLNDAIRQLTLGDRAILIIQIRAALLGEKIHALLNCPFCKESLSFELSSKSLAPQSIANPVVAYPLKFENFLLMVKPVTGAVLEAIAESSSINYSIEQLARLCIVSSKPVLPEKLSDELLATVSSKLREIDPQADIVLNLVCPVCNRPFQVPFEIEEYFFNEMAGRLGQLEREIHWIALNYHWSEKEILSLPIAKRKRYIELINATVAGESA